MSPTNALMKAAGDAAFVTLACYLLFALADTIVDRLRKRRNRRSPRDDRSW